MSESPNTHTPMAAAVSSKKASRAKPHRHKTSKISSSKKPPHASPRTRRQSAARDFRSKSVAKKKDYEECIFDLLTPAEWKHFKNLETVLDQQLVLVNTCTRATQVDWNWKKMADRWKHGVVITPTSLKNPPYNPMKALNDLRIVRQGIDKMVDTKGLDFDPSDPNLRYTKIPSAPQPEPIPLDQGDTDKASQNGRKKSSEGEVQSAPEQAAPILKL